MTHVTERWVRLKRWSARKTAEPSTGAWSNTSDEIAAMRRLVRLAPKSGVAAALSQRMQVAVKRADSVEDP